MSMVFFFHGTATTELYTTETLFPYTPLFRSQPSGGLGVAAIDGARRNRRRARRRVVLIDPLGLLDQRADFQIGDRLHADGTADDVDCCGRAVKLQATRFMASVRHGAVEKLAFVDRRRVPGIGNALFGVRRVIDRRPA